MHFFIYFQIKEPQEIYTNVHGTVNYTELLTGNFKLNLKHKDTDIFSSYHSIQIALHYKNWEELTSEE